MTEADSGGRVFELHGGYNGQPHTIMFDPDSVVRQNAALVGLELSEAEIAARVERITHYLDRWQNGLPVEQPGTRKRIGGRILELFRRN